MFNPIEAAPPDAILGLTEAFKADPNPDKINLGVGVYKDEQGLTPIPAAVKAAEARILESENSKSYLPIGGDPAYGRHVRTMLFGSGHDLVDDGRSVTLHSPGGTGALRVGGEFLATVFDAAPTLWHSQPTWANHRAVFTAAGLPLNTYRYYDADTKALDREGFFADLEQVPAGDVVLLHVCCHNPTGVDLGADDWQTVAELASDRGFLPFFDFAYQGFGDGLAEDRAALAPFIEAGLEFLVANSFSKNFGLYKERTGGLTLVAGSADAASRAGSRLKKVVRANYSNPASHGGAIVTTILDDADLTAQWEAELAGMRDRIKQLRRDLVAGLAARGVPGDFSFIEAQRGMFSFSGLNDDQVATLKDTYSIYVVGGGRINVAGISSSNLDRLCDALAAVIG